MKRFVVIGLGNFGSSIARAFYAQGHEIVTLDVDETVVDNIASHVSRAAENLAARLAQAESILNYVRLGPEFSIQEMAVPNLWIGKSLCDLDVRASCGVTITAVHDVLTDQMNPVPDPNVPLDDSDALLVVGPHEKLAKVAQIS